MEKYSYGMSRNYRVSIRPELIGIIQLKIFQLLALSMKNCEVQLYSAVNERGFTKVSFNVQCNIHVFSLEKVYKKMRLKLSKTLRKS